MNALGAAALSVVMVVVLLAPKRWALVGMTAGVLYLTQGQMVSVAGFELYPVRFVELAAFVRIVVRKEFSFSRMNRIDEGLILLYVYTTGVFLLRSDEGQAYQIGTAVDAFFSYFAFRGLLPDDDLESFRQFLRTFAVMLAPFALSVAIETLTFNNPFAVIGGVELVRGGDLWFRGDRLRAVGSFGHPSLMGTMGGSFLPLYIGLRFDRKHRRVAVLGIFLCMMLVWASNSGGPATCVAATLAGWALWTMRTRMQLVRRGLVALVVALVIVMKAPIWYLIARASSVVGGDGWHRGALMDVAFQNLDKWWLAGMRPLDTAGWLPYTNTLTGAVDLTNHFLVFGIAAGMGAVILLVMLLTQGFRHVGNLLGAARLPGSDGREAEALYWGLGVMLWVHILNWFGISYWDQSNLLWFLHLAIISSLAGGYSRALNVARDEQAPQLAAARPVR